MSAAEQMITKDVEATQVPDLIEQTVKDVSQLDRDAAFSLVPSLIESVDFSYFKLGGVLSVIQDNDWWTGESNTFKDFIQDNIGLHYRKAMYLIKIYDGLVESGVPWAKVSGLGWTKLKELADILTLANVDEWVAKASSMTTLNLQAAVKAYKAGQLGVDGTTDPDSSGVSTITFKVHPDQKESINEAVEKAMEEAGTEFKGVALEAICLNYLAGGNTQSPKNVSLVALFEKAGIEKVFEAVEAAFPELEVTVKM